MKNDKTPAKPNKKQKELIAYELHLLGKTAQQIADELDVSVPTAYRYKQTAQDRINEMQAAPIIEQRNLAAAQLQAILEGTWQQATAGDIKAANAANNIINSKVKLLGLAVPTVSNVNSTVKADVKAGIDLQVVTRTEEEQRILNEAYELSQLSDEDLQAKLVELNRHTTGLATVGNPFLDTESTTND